MRRKIDIFSHASRTAGPKWSRKSSTGACKCKRSRSCICGCCKRRRREQLQSREKLYELRVNRLKRKLLQGTPLRFGNKRGTGTDIAQQLQRDGSDFVDRASSAAALRKRDSFNRAISAHASGPAKKRVTRDLPRHAAAVQLQNDFMPRDLAQIIRVRFSFLDDAQFSIGKF